MNFPRTLFLLVVAALSAAVAPQALAISVTVECSFAGSGDFTDRGIYVDNYNGTSLRTVTLAHSATVPGERTISLTARLTSFNGTFLGVASVTRTISTGMSKSVFDFGNIPVAPGSRITFSQAIVAGDSSVFFDTGIGPCANVVET